MDQSKATTVITIGLSLLMFVPEVNWLIFPGAFFLFCGTYPLVITNHPLSLLFPAATAVIVTSAQVCGRRWTDGQMEEVRPCLECSLLKTFLLGSFPNFRFGLQNLVLHGRKWNFVQSCS